MGISTDMEMDMVCGDDFWVGLSGSSVALFARAIYYVGAVVVGR